MSVGWMVKSGAGWCGGAHRVCGKVDCGYWDNSQCCGKNNSLTCVIGTKHCSVTTPPIGRAVKPLEHRPVLMLYLQGLESCAGKNIAICVHLGRSPKWPILSGVHFRSALQLRYFARVARGYFFCTIDGSLALVVAWLGYILLLLPFP